MSIMSEMQGKFVDYFGTGEPVEVLDVYTRSRAIEDGVLIDVSELAKEAGFKYPLAVTSRVFHEVIVPPEGMITQDKIGRLWDLLNILRVEIKKSCPGQDRIDFYFLVQNKPGKPPQKEYLYATCGPGDDFEPVLTVMMPDED